MFVVASGLLDASAVSHVRVQGMINGLLVDDPSTSDLDRPNLRAA